MAYTYQQNKHISMARCGNICAHRASAAGKRIARKHGSVGAACCHSVSIKCGINGNARACRVTSSRQRAHISKRDGVIIGIMKGSAASSYHLSYIKNIEAISSVAAARRQRISSGLAWRQSATRVARMRWQQEKRRGVWQHGENKRSISISKRIVYRRQQ